MDIFKDLYQQLIIDHNQHPQNFRRLENHSHSAEGHNPLCGDEITISLIEKNGIIDDKGMEINRLTGIINKLNESNSRLQRDIRKMTENNSKLLSNIKHGNKKKSNSYNKKNKKDR